MDRNSSKKRSDALSGGEIIVLVVLPLLLLVGATAYVAASVSGFFAHGHLAHDRRAMPFIGWGLVGLDGLLHGADPASAWPRTAGVGPALLVWVLFVVFVATEVLVASRIRWVRTKCSAAAGALKSSSRRGAGSAGMTAAQAKRHNEGLGVG